MYILRRLAYVVAICAASVHLVTPSLAADQTAAQVESVQEPQRVFSDLPVDAYDLIMAVTRKRMLMSRYVIGIQRGGVSYVPMTELARVVKFRAEPDYKRAVLSGFYLSPENAYSIDARRGTYTLRGEEFELPPDSLIVLDRGGGLGEFYLDVNLVNKIWPLVLEVDQADMALRINTPRKLPFELEKERELRRQLLLARSGEAEEGSFGLTYVPNDYRAISKPVVTVTNQLSYSENEGVEERLSLAGRNDLLFTSADYNAILRSNSDSALDLERLRLRLTRRALKGDELPFGLKMVQAGDINVKMPDRVIGTARGRGVYVSTKPLKRDQEFDRVTIEGLGTPGWEIELYRGNELLDFGTVAEDGTYFFEDIPLGFGNNEIRVVLYGPEGQIHEDVKTYQVSGNMLSPGETVFDAGIVDNNANFSPIGNDEPERRTDGVALTAKVVRGLNTHVTGFATASRVTSNDEPGHYVSAGVEAALPGGLARVEGFKQLDGGMALDGRYVTKFAGLNLNMRGTVYSDFESEEAGSGLVKKQYEAAIRARTSVPLSFTNLGLNADVTRIGFENGTTRTKIGTGQSMRLGQVRLNNSTRSTLENGEHGNTSGRISAGVRLSRAWQFRGSLGYDIYPDFEPDQTELEILYNNRRGFSASANVRESLNDDGRTFGLHGSYDNGHVINGVDLNWQQDSGLSMVWRATTSLGPFGKDGKYIHSSASMSGSSALAARVFHDKNYDGVFNGDDELLEGVQLNVGDRKSPESDADGETRLLNAGSIGLADIGLQRESLENPFLVSAEDGYYTVLRPGTQPYIDMPLIMSGVIDGHVYFADGRPISGIRLLLVDEAGNVVDETTTSFDGFYTFEYVKPGKYEVRVPDDYEFHIPPITVWVASDELFAYGEDLKVLGQESEAEDVEAADEAAIRDRGRVAQTNHDRADASSEGAVDPAPNSSDGRFSVVANRVRIGEHPGKVRLVMDLSGAADYIVKEEENGRIVNIDLPGTAWDSLKSWRGAHTPILDGFQALSLPEGQGTRLQLKARSRMHVSVFGLLPPSPGQPNYRLYIDLVE